MGNIDDFVVFSHKLADASDSITSKYFRDKNISLEAANKINNGFDPVTLADKESEKAIRHLISKEFPTHGIIGEEFGSQNPDADYVWVLDPIDGTKSFIYGVPLWATLISLFYKNKPIVGMISQPILGERYFGTNDKAFFSNSFGITNLSVSNVGDLHDAKLATTDKDFFTSKQIDKFLSLDSATKITRYGGDAYFYCQLANGFIDIVMESQLQIYDIGAIIPVINGAGGIISTWNGSEVCLQDFDGTIIASPNINMHNNVLKLIQ